MHADELNLDGLSPDEVRDALPIIRSRCEEIGRDPDTLRVSVHVWQFTDAWAATGEARRELLAGYAELGVSRVMGLLRATSLSDDALEALASDAIATRGVEMAPASRS